MLVILLIIFLAMWSHSGVAGQPSRNILHEIVAHCLDSSIPDYCVRCPAPLSGQCAKNDECSRTSEVWAQTDDYVAIGDIKMCGCPAGFVHGLAMTRVPVSGVEDTQRPAGIWPFAWAVARQRIPEETGIGLVVNPAYPALSGSSSYSPRAAPARRAAETREPNSIACRTPRGCLGRRKAPCCETWAPHLRRDCRARVRRQLSGHSGWGQSRARVYTIPLSIDVRRRAFLHGGNGGDSA